MANPTLLEQFCSSGQKDAVSSILQTAGWSPENPNINGYQLNTIFNEIYTYLNYLKNKGLSFWESTKTYKATTGDIDIVRYANKIYFAKQDSNLDGTTPMQPDTNPTYWGVLYDLDKPLESTYALLGGSATQRFKVADAVNADEAVSKAQINTKANINGDNTKTFKVADAVNADEALSKGQLDALNALPKLENVSIIQLKVDNGNKEYFYTDSNFINIGNDIPGDILVKGSRITTISEFNSNGSSNGYQKLPSGVIIQWGQTTAPANGTSAAINFPIVFPGAVSLCFGNRVTANSNAVDGNSSGAFALSGSQYKVFSDDNSVDVAWIAIGY